MPRNKIKQDFHFTTLKRLKIIINKLVIDSTMTKYCTFYDVCLFLSSLSIVTIFVYVEKI